MYGAQCAWGAAQPQRTCALHGAAQCAQRIYGAQCACMGRSSAAAHMRTARRGAAHCPADKMGAADGTCCARCVLSTLCCTRCAPCVLRSISALLYTLCAALHVCDTAQRAECPCRSAAQRCAAYTCTTLKIDGTSLHHSHTKRPCLFCSELELAQICAWNDWMAR